MEIISAQCANTILCQSLILISDISEVKCSVLVDNHQIASDYHQIRRRSWNTVTHVCLNFSNKTEIDFRLRAWPTSAVKRLLFQWSLTDTFTGDVSFNPICIKLGKVASVLGSACLSYAPAISCIHEATVNPKGRGKCHW